MPQQGSKHIDVFRREAVRDTEVVFQRLVHAGDHIAHDFVRRVPDAELFSQGGVERFEERLVEIRHRLALAEAGEEGFSIHAIQRGGRPVQHLDQIQKSEGGQGQKSAGRDYASLARADARRPHAS